MKKNNTHQNTENQIPILAKKNERRPIRKAMLLIFLILILFIGFLYIQQMLLDLEAIAIVQAKQTAAANNESSHEIIPDATKTIDAIETKITKSSLSGSLDMNSIHTATVAAQLTSVAEFQMTVTPSQ